MSETNLARYDSGSNAANRSLEEQHRLMQEFEEAGYTEAQGTEEEYSEALAAREQERLAEIEGRIMESVETRRMYMIAQHIAELRQRPVGEDADSILHQIADKEDKLQELLITYADSAVEARSLAQNAAGMERGTPKGQRLAQEARDQADVAYGERSEEIDFILNTAAGEYDTAGAKDDSVSRSSEKKNDEESTEKESTANDIDASDEAVDDGSSAEQNESNDEESTEKESTANDIDASDEAVDDGSSAEQNESNDEEEAKRRADIRVIRGMSGGKLSDEEIENILGHFSGRSSKLEVKEPVANSNQEAAQDTLPSLEATDAGAEGLEMLDESGTGAGDLETLDEAETPTQPRSRLRRIRDVFTPTGLKAAVDTSLYMRRRERNGRLLTRREKIAAGIGAAAFMMGAGYLMMKGHDVFGGGTGSGTGVTGSGGGSPLDVLAQNNPHDVDARRSASTAAKVIEQLNQPFDVEYGNGYIREIQQQAAELGAEISPQRAEQIHHALVEKVGPDYINIQGTNGNDIYTQAGDIRLAAPGKANWDPAAVKTIADQLGLSK